MSKLTEVEARELELAKLELRSVLESQPARRFLWRLIERTSGAFNASFAEGDALTTAYNEGKRGVGLLLIKQLQDASPAGYLLMLQEAMDANHRRQELAQHELEAAEEDAEAEEL